MIFYDLLAWLDGDGCSRYLSYLPRLCQDSEPVVGGVDACPQLNALGPTSASFTYIPRALAADPRIVQRGVMVALSPSSLQEARSLAKARLRVPATLLVRFSNLRFFDEGEVRVLSQNRARPFLEVCLGEIVSEGIARNRLGWALRRASLLLEQVLREGVEAVISSCTRRGSHPLLCGQGEGVLMAMGFSRSERSSLLYTYPAELVERWRGVE